MPKSFEFCVHNEVKQASGVFLLVWMTDLSAEQSLRCEVLSK